MNKIAEATSDTSFTTIQPTTGFAEIGDRRELTVDGARCVPAGVKRIAGFLRRVFVLEACIDVANEIYHRISQHLSLLNTQEKERETYDHCYYHTRPPLQSPQTCTSRTRSPRRKRQSGFAADSGSSYSLGRRPGFGTGLGGGWFGCRRA